MLSNFAFRTLALVGVLTVASISSAGATAQGFTRTQVALGLNGASLLSTTNEDYTYNNEISGTGQFSTNTGGFFNVNAGIYEMFSETFATASPNGIARGLFGHAFFFTLKNETSNALTVDFGVELERDGTASVDNLSYEKAWVNLFGGVSKVTTGIDDFRTDSLETDPSYFVTGSYTHDYMASFNLDPNEEATFEIWASTESYARSVVPEPASMATLALGALALLKRRRKSA